MQANEAKGVRIPAVGLGTMMLKGDACIETVSTALRLGYRHIDTAQLYGNEREVGEGIRASGVRREDVFLTTKVTWTRLHEFAKAVDDSLVSLKVPCVDLLLIHWQGHHLSVTDTVKALCTFRKQGLARNIGVANFTVAMLDETMAAATEPLITNQIEVHPFLDQTKVIAACRKHGMAITAYCPNARGKVFGHPVLERIGRAHGKTVAQVALRWLVQQGMIPIPRTGNPAHLAENIDLFDFALSPAEMAEIAALKRHDGRVINPPHAPLWDV